MAFLGAFSGAGATFLLRGARGSWWLLLIALSFPGAPSPARAAPATITREYQIKAVFLFNFVQFVEWPATAFPGAEAPLRIGVLGDNPFGGALEDAVRGETIHDRRLTVAYSRRVEDLEGCHLLFIAKSESRSLDDVLARLRSRPVLTVSEIEGFAREGGVIAFYSEGKKVRFEINAGVARGAGLKMSSELLSLGRIVGAPAPGEDSSG